MSEGDIRASLSFLSRACCAQILPLPNVEGSIVFIIIRGMRKLTNG